MEIVYQNKNNEETKEQKSDWIHEVTQDSNGLFEGQTKLERETAGKQLGKKQERYNTPMGYPQEVNDFNNIQHQNIDQQMPAVVAPQNAAIQ